MSIQNKPNLKTLQDVIDYTTMYDKRDFFTNPDNKFNDETLFDRYRYLIDPYIVRVAVKDSHKKYSRNPKQLSCDLYNTPDLDWVLLKINNMTSMNFFLQDKINYIESADMERIFTLLLSNK